MINNNEMKTKEVRRNTTLPLRIDAFVALYKMDGNYVGTQEYMGLAPYWGNVYKHFFRLAEPTLRAQVYDAFINAGLPLDGVSEDHEQIIEPFVPANLVEVWEEAKAYRRKIAQAKS